MGSKPLKQNLDAVVSKRSSGRKIAQNINQKAITNARAEVEAHGAIIRQLEDRIIAKDLENSALRAEVEGLREQLKSISKKSTGEVTDGDLELKNKSSVAKKLPRSQ